MIRTVAVQGGVNFRDFGGYQGSGSRQVKTDLLYRCGQLSELTQQGEQDFANLDVGLICDLRRPDECEEHPTPFPESATERLWLPIDPGSASNLRGQAMVSGLTAKECIDYLCAINAELVRDHVSTYAQMVDGLVNLDNGSFVVHCTAGKDRTGVAVALIQLLLGVSEADVMQDYLHTNDAVDFDTYIVPMLSRKYNTKKLDLEVARALWCVREEYLATALDTIKAHFGSIDSYLKDQLDLSDEKRDILAERYLS